MYTGHLIRISRAGVMSDYFNALNGEKQGGVVSPIFVLYLYWWFASQFVSDRSWLLYCWQFCWSNCVWWRFRCNQPNVVGYEKAFVHMRFICRWVWYTIWLDDSQERFGGPNTTLLHSFRSKAATDINDIFLLSQSSLTASIQVFRGLPLGLLPWILPWITLTGILTGFLLTVRLK